MQCCRPKWILAGAAAGLLLGGAALGDGVREASVAALRNIAGRSALSSSAPVSPASLSPAPLAAPQQYGNYRASRDFVLRSGGGVHEFYFTRGIYSGGGGYGWRRRDSWATDYPKADRQFLWGLKRLSNIDAYELENPVLLTDPELRRYPFLYMLEVGYMHLSPPEVEALRAYLDAGGFVFIDDFWGTYEWANFEWEIQQVLPEYDIVELPLDHPLFSQFYVITEILQVPNVGNARSGRGTWEQDGYVPHVRAIFDDNGKLLVLINWNTDLGDAWEWAEDPWYPLLYSNFAYQLAVNAIIYAMSH